MKKNILHRADICVIGGGLAGMCAAISAARHGSKVVLIHDRPVPGGNCSSEVRMWPLGAHGSNHRETGIFEEIVLKNMYRNPMRTYPIWDAVLFESVRYQDGLESILNCSVNDAQMDGDRIVSVTGWQLTTYQNHIVEADIFIDCSGDSILAELTGAQYRHGREARGEFGEEAAPETADRKTMGNSCLLQARETPRPVKFVPPAWIRPLHDESKLSGRGHTLTDYVACNFWWLELGGDRDTINDAEMIRDDLLSLAFGTWDHIKNHGEHNSENWDLDWAGFLPGKRESRRYVGAHILNQNEVQAGGKFEDIIAYGGWKIDDHPPAGFDHDGEPTKYYPCPSPFGIPYRCLYSVNIRNLMFAGRNISVTHAAMAASRVMATCAMLGQAAGTAASVAAQKRVSPADAGEYIGTIQQMLMEDDCWLPGLKRKIDESCAAAKLSARCEGVENLRNGFDRPDDDGADNGCCVPFGSDVTYTLTRREHVKELRIIFDSDLDRKTVEGGIKEVRNCPTICNRPLDMEPYTFPATMTKEFEIYIDGKLFKKVTENHQRLVRIPVGLEADSITLRPVATYGAEMSHIFSFDFKVSQQ